MAFDRWKKKKKEEPKKPRVFVATPAYDGKVDTDYAISLAESCMFATNEGINVVAGVMANGAFIDLARCNFVEMFLRTDCTHLFFIDADLKWEARGFLGLVLSERPVSAGVYRRRQEPEDYPVRYIEDPRNGIQTVDGGWIACDRVPTGFLCIQRHVIEEMAKEARWIKQAGRPDVPQLFYTKIMDNDHFMGEDFAWCDDYVKKYKEPIYVWPDLTFKHGGYDCNWAEFLNKKVEEFLAEEEREKQRVAAIAS